MDTVAFERYITDVLGPTLRPGQVVILDNLTAHKAICIRNALAARHCDVLFLPPLSLFCHLGNWVCHQLAGNPVESRSQALRLLRQVASRDARIVLASIPT